MRKFRRVAEVDVVNGRGGDGGVDVSVTYPDGRLVIYQLKYYPEGMSGGFVGRRDKVKKSFVRAVKEQDVICHRYGATWIATSMGPPWRVIEDALRGWVGQVRVGVVGGRRGPR